MSHEGAREAGGKVVPKLRFPEFQDAGEWRRTALESICEILNNRRRPITSNERTPGPYPYYGASGIVDYVGDCIFDERLLLIGEDGAKWGAFEATAFIAEGQYWVNNHAHVLKPISASDTFLENYLTMMDLGPFVTGAAPPKLTLGKLKSIPIPLPSSTSEQQKIAACLDSVDALIAAQGRKVEALKAHKKGLMHQLFPQTGKIQPHLRFPEFEGAGEWIEDTLGNLFDITSGSTPERSREDYWNGGIPWITTSLVNFNVISVATEYISEAGLKNSSAKIFPENTILLAMYGQGKTRGKAAMLGVSAATNQACAAILPRKGINQNFVFLNLVSRYEEMRGISNSGGQENLSQSLIKGISFSYPSDPVEQQRIADCLTSLDDLITAETRKLDTLKVHKKGLMQQLFPQAEGVDG